MKKRGDAAVIEYTNKFDRLSAKAMVDLELRKDELQAALDGLPAERRAALEAELGHPVLLMSGVSRNGVTEVLRALWREIEPSRAPAAPDTPYGSWQP